MAGTILLRKVTIMNATRKSFLVRHARPIGWVLTAIAGLMAYAWISRPFGPPHENYAIMWSLVIGMVIITAANMILSVKSKCHDLIIAGMIAFYSTFIIAYGIRFLASFFN